MTVWEWQERWVPASCDSTFLSVSVLKGWYPSKSAAQKGIEKGEISYFQPRLKYEIAGSIITFNHAHIKVPKYNTQLPTGWPIIVIKKKPYCMSAEVMVPLECQTRRVWTAIWNESTADWWDEMIDKIETKKYKDALEMIERENAPQECLDDLFARIEKWFKKKMRSQYEQGK